MLARTSESSPQDNKVGGHIPTATSALYVVSEMMTRLNRASLNLETYNQPKTGMSLICLLVESLMLRHPVLGVDQTVSWLANDFGTAVVKTPKRSRN